MKIDKIVLKETKYISLAVLVCSLIMQAFFLILGEYDYTVFLGSLFGGSIAILNFFLLGITVQNVASIEDKKQAKQKIQFSYSMRMLGLIAAIVAGITVPFFNYIPALISLLFPRIYYIAVPFFRKDLKKEEGELSDGS